MDMEEYSTSKKPKLSQAQHEKRVPEHEDWLMFVMCYFDILRYSRLVEEELESK